MKKWDISQPSIRRFSTVGYRKVFGSGAVRSGATETLDVAYAKRGPSLVAAIGVLGADGLYARIAARGELCVEADS